jgi:molecular chaperone GrpE
MNDISDMNKDNDTQAKDQGKNPDRDQAAKDQHAPSKEEAGAADAKAEGAAKKPASKEESLEELRTEMLRQVAKERNEKEAFIARAEKEMEMARRYAVSDLATSLLSITDDLERALSETQKRKDTEAATGLSLILKNLQDALSKHDIKMIEAKPGDVFDPHHHEAILLQESDKHDKNTLIEIAQGGYTLGDRVLRPVRVVVAKEPEAKNAKQDNEGKEHDKNEQKDKAAKTDDGKNSQK